MTGSAKKLASIANGCSPFLFKKSVAREATINILTKQAHLEGGGKTANKTKTHLDHWPLR